MVDAGALLSSADQVPGWGYLLLFGITTAQLIPNGSVVMASAALAGRGGMSLPLLTFVVLAGMLCGDLLAYGLARKVGGRVPGDLACRIPPRLRARVTRLLKGAAASVHRNGVGVLVTLRFVPGGRATGATAAGLGGCSAARYMGAAVLAEATWTGVFVGIGYAGGKVAPGPLLAVGVALVMGGVMGLVGLFLRRRCDAAAPRGSAVRVLPSAQRAPSEPGLSQR